MKALESKDKQVIWHDRRKEITAQSLDIDNAFGFIVNIPSDYTFAFIRLPISSRHWIAIRKLSDNNFYLLDSKLEKEKKIGDEEELVTYLNNEMTSNDKELFIVIPRKAE
jgi:josephin